MSSQELKNKTKFYVHVFPSDKFDWDSIKLDVDKKVLYIQHLFESHNSSNKKPLAKFWCFKTDGIFLNSCQSEVNTSVTSRIVERLYLGIDHLVMSYGQNYSGKSFTMSGFYNQYEVRGIIPRFVVDIFKQLEGKREDYTSTIWISVVDIHRNLMYDLLSYPRRLCKEFKDVKRMEVSSEERCLELLFKAEAQRVIVKKKAYNSHSSTNIITFTVKLTSVNSNMPDDKISKINFVDLAGVETIYRNPLTSFKDQYDQGDANVTKTLLELFALRSQKSKTPATFRVNQNIHLLTKYLGKSFSPLSCISLICHIRTNHEHIKITLSALKFGMAFQGIPMVKPEEHTEANYEMTLNKLSEEIQNLKDELVIINLAEQKSPIIMSQERIYFVERAVQSFLEGGLSETELLSLVDDPNLILNIVKRIHNQPIPKLSINIQTDDIPEPPTNLKKLSRRESVKVDETTVSPNKKVSIIEKAGKAKGADKLKTNKPDLKSEEVQVNLTEPNATLPNLDSREGLWALFLISRPDVYEALDKLNTAVAEKNKKLNTESTMYDNISRSINKTHQALNELVTYTHSESKETYDDKAKVVVSEVESNLVNELRQLQRDLEQSKQKLIDSQFDWLEALEKLHNEKQTVEEKFKHFCIDNNFLAIDHKTEEEEAEEAPVVRQSELITDKNRIELELKEVYCTLQKKYLNKLTL